jgi:hypothetical protein
MVRKVGDSDFEYKEKMRKRRRKNEAADLRVIAEQENITQALMTLRLVKHDHHQKGTL